MDDIGHLAPWIFSASGHGKSIVDGIGGCLMQKAADESKMKGLKEPIIDAKSFHNFVIRKKYQTIPILISTEEINQKELDLDSRWKKSSTLKDTQKFHHYEIDPDDKEFIVVKRFSLSKVAKRVRLLKKQTAKKK